MSECLPLDEGGAAMLGDSGYLVAVTGATGYVGGLVVSELRRQGANVVELGRRAGGPGSEARHFELGAPLDAQLLTDVDVVVHCAYDLSLRSRKDVWNTNVAGTRDLVDRAARDGVRRMILISSMSAYEGTEQLYGQAKLACERLVLRGGGIVVRLGLVFGVGGGGMIGALQRLARLPVVPLLGAEARQFVVREATVGEAVAALIGDRELAGEIIGLAHPEPVAFREVLRSLRVGGEIRTFTVPWKPVYTAMKAAERVGLKTPLRADSVLGLVHTAPSVPGFHAWNRLGVTVRPFDSDREGIVGRARQQRETMRREVDKVYLPGHATSFPTNVAYRMAKLRQHVDVSGDWLDYGCAEGGYTSALLETGAATVMGVDLEPDRIAEARQRGIPGTVFNCLDAETLTVPAGAATFDGVFVNEVLEHVQDEQCTLRELLRVIKPGGTLAVMSPNRWFPFDGHGIDVGRWSSKRPTFLVPWLPSFLTKRILRARNYWPHELRSVVAASGFRVRDTDTVLPVLEQHPWLPPRLVKSYQTNLMKIERIPVLRRFGVSTLVVAVRL